MFKCLCDYSQAINNEKQILEHIDKCSQFNSDSPLCKMVNRANINQLPLEQLITFRCDLQLQLMRINAIISKLQNNHEEELDLNYYSKFTSQIMVHDTKKLESMVMQVEIKNSDEKSQQSQKTPEKHYPIAPTMMIEEPVQKLEKIENETNSDIKLVCEACRKSYYNNRDSDKLWFINQCCHMICRPCIMRMAIEKYVEQDGKIVCPELGCGARLSDYELTEVIGREKFQELGHKLTMKSQNVVECCKCKSLYAFEKGSPNEQIKDGQGKQIIGDNLIHYINNRFKCSACNIDQCKTCHAVPYHANFTCETYKQNLMAQKCRLCEQPAKGDASRVEALRSICDAEDCQRRMKYLCTIKLKCGHFCCGVIDEECICLDVKCSAQQSEDDYCNLCFTEALKSAPCVRSKCGHVFHQECVIKRLENKWNGPRIIFNYCQCPLCKAFLDIKSKGITPLLEQSQKLKFEVQDLCMERLEIEKMKNAKELNDPKHEFYHKPQEFGMNVFCFYECFKCKKPYFGGMKNCQAAAEQDNRQQQFNKEDLICPDCCPISFESKCPKHGTKYIEFKCRFCCSLALWFCGGTTHYCEPCHNGTNRLMNKPCPGQQKCPLGVAHKPNGQECALGCSLCRSKRVDDIMKLKN